MRPAFVAGAVFGFFHECRKLAPGDLGLAHSKGSNIDPMHRAFVFNPPNLRTGRAHVKASRGDGYHLWTGGTVAENFACFRRLCGPR